MTRTARAEVLIKQAKAVQLAQAGYSYDQIAEQLGYANRSSTWRLVQNALARSVHEHVGVLREMELERLDAIAAAFWEQALGGDIKAARMLLHVSELRGKLLGFEELVKRPASRPHPSHCPLRVLGCPGRPSC